MARWRAGETPAVPDDLIDVLKPWGITPAAVAVLPGGEKNDRHSSGNCVVVRRYRTSTIPEIEYELHATAFLAQNGYPTPAPVPPRMERCGATWTAAEPQYSHSPTVCTRPRRSTGTGQV